MPRKQQPCIVCGEPTIGKRCKMHNGEREKFLALERTRESDAELLRMRDEGLINIRIAEQLGVSRSSLGERMKKAEMREAQRRALDLGGNGSGEMAVAST